jgi:uncharacterized Zn-binding protein involved in type VI secretion
MSKSQTSGQSSLEFAVKATHWFATIGSVVERRGRVTTATSSRTIAGLAVARVGDVVTYDDGSQAIVIDGAGCAAISCDKPVALVGSRLSNGDRIVESLQRRRGIAEYHGKPIDGLFDPTYVPPSRAPNYRLAVRGATTARGGVLREPSSKWELSGRLGKAGAVGDLIHYPDGSIARIISGLGLTNVDDYQPLAFVGSALDNGDTITDSPERTGSASPTAFAIVKRCAVVGLTRGSE